MLIFFFFLETPLPIPLLYYNHINTFLVSYCLDITLPENQFIVHEPYWHFQSLRERPVEENLYPKDLHFPWMWWWPVELNEVNLNKCYTSNWRDRNGRLWHHWGRWKRMWRDHWGSVPSRSSLIHQNVLGNQWLPAGLTYSLPDIIVVGTEEL